jgi:hypothetical protein
MSDIVDRRLLDIAIVLKCDDDDGLRADVMQCAKTARLVATVVEKLKLDPSAIRKAAQNAIDALDALDKVFPVYPRKLDGLEIVRVDGLDGTNDFRAVRSRIELPTTRGQHGKYLHGPDPRFNVLHWECAHQAYKLIKRYGHKPVTQRDGNAHLITQWLVEIATGGEQRPDEYGKPDWLLKLVRRVHRHLNPLPPLPEN